MYDELAKVMLMIVVEDQILDEVVAAITDAGRTGQFGDGKIFISTVDEVVRIRTGEKGITAI